jgi:drug/metabolite transporter (DMT)-like permease
VTRRSGRWAGIAAVVVAVLCFSVSSSMVKLAETPGVTVAFWRMVLGTLVWLAILGAQRRRITWSGVRLAWPAGVLFGLNISLFFMGVTRTSIANAEFLGSLTPLVLVPVGVVLFHEHLDLRALAFGGLALVGVAIVLFFGPSSGTSTLAGNLIVCAAVVTWASYLAVTRRIREHMDVTDLMATTAPIAALTILPLVIARGGVTDVSAEGWAYIVGLVFLTGVVAHGLILVAQRLVPLATISILQVAQPALAVAWAYVLLDETIVAIQVVGMVLVLVGLAAFTIVSQRGSAPTRAALDEVEPHPAG